MQGKLAVNPGRARLKSLPLYHRPPVSTWAKSQGLRQLSELLNYPVSTTELYWHNEFSYLGVLYKNEITVSVLKDLSSNLASGLCDLGQIIKTVPALVSSTIK